MTRKSRHETANRSSRRRRRRTLPVLILVLSLILTAADGLPVLQVQAEEVMEVTQDSIPAPEETGPAEVPETGETEEPTEEAVPEAEGPEPATEEENTGEGTTPAVEETEVPSETAEPAGEIVIGEELPEPEEPEEAAEKTEEPEGVDGEAAEPENEEIEENGDPEPEDDGEEDGDWEEEEEELILTDLFFDPRKGSDENDGSSEDRPFKTLNALLNLAELRTNFEDTLTIHEKAGHGTPATDTLSSGYLAFLNAVIVLYGQEEPAPYEGIYLDPVNGSDENSGASPDEAVATLEYALSLSPSPLHVMNEVAITQDTSLSGIRVLRYETYTGALFQVRSGRLVLSDTTIDGQKDLFEEEGFPCTALVVVSGGELVLKDGVAIKDAYGGRASDMSDGFQVTDYGGGICVESGGSLIMESGSAVQNCSGVLGGGVHCEGSFTMNGGTISGCEAIYHPISSLDASGGGVAVSRGGSMVMNGGSISGNRATLGGGLMIGGSKRFLEGSTFTMTGGTVSGNDAFGPGGGLYLQCGCTGTITGGMFSSNITNATTYGGGGIYVNGGQRDPDDRESMLEDAVLYLEDTLMTGNHAFLYGSGMAACPSSNSSLSLLYGIAMYDNRSDTEPYSQLYISNNDPLGNHRGGAGPEVVISERMPGGGKASWIDTLTGDPVSEDLLDTLYTLQNSTVVQYTTDPDTGARQKAEAQAKVRITGNDAPDGFGGGIAVNGTIRFGTGKGILFVDKTVTDEDGNEIEDNGTYTMDITLSDSLNGTYGQMTFKDGKTQLHLKNKDSIYAEGLPSGCTYTVTEEETDGYVTHLTGDTGTIEENKASRCHVVNEKKKMPPPEPEPETTSITVSKVWKDDTEEVRPESIIIYLTIDGEKAEPALVLAADTEWAGVFEGLPVNDSVYGIIEEEVEGYTDEVTGSAEDGFIVTNTRVPEEILEPEPEPTPEPVPEPEPIPEPVPEPETESFLTSITVTKVWVDNNSASRPSSAKVYLTVDGVKTDQSLELTSSSSWTGSFTDLPVGAGVYGVVEEEVSGYTSSVTGDAETGFTVTNTLTPVPVPEPALTDITVTKAWVDDTSETRPSSVTVYLTIDGVRTDQSLVLTSDGSWAGTFPDLPVGAGTYGVVEEDIPGYTSSVTGDAETGFTVTNTLVPVSEPEPSLTVTVTKVWNDGGDGSRRSPVLVNLMLEKRHRGFCSSDCRLRVDMGVCGSSGTGNRCVHGGGGRQHTRVCEPYHGRCRYRFCDHQHQDYGTGDREGLGR